ncbi:MAG: FAD-binding protein [Bacteroidales bacterium]|jgi:FAD/FMN-containing dehydrogenase/Fe-S oxidoreductase|nr:FAD-binding protein [Bacteroidales bacterium]NLB86241.1 FAD-binding protein [Bacteroidales bacterium]
MQILEALKQEIQGEVKLDNIYKILYSTDASAYREIPKAIVYPKNKDDLISIIKFANKNNLSLIPRAAGTSLAGQVVGNGIIVDISRSFNNILEINKSEKWVKLEPGVVLDELNKVLAKENLFFGPETSTSNRCMIGGMIGNNSCGAHSLIYGSTRDHVLEMDCILSDGSEVKFGEISKSEFEEKCKLHNLEGEIYRQIQTLLSDSEFIKEIDEQFPAKEIKRRNTGYALDLLADSEIFGDSKNKFNLCKLLAGSEGSLAFTSSVKLNLVDLPPKTKALLCVHTQTLQEVFEANLVALKYSPVSIELMDKKVLDLTKKNIQQNRNRFFVKGDPAAILIVEWFANDIEAINSLAKKLEEELRSKSLGYAYPMVYAEDIAKVWELRKAGLGVLSNMPGDAKPVPVVEDTAVRPEDLPAYMQDFEALMQKYGLDCVYYAHIATGELHLRPVLNLKDKKHVELFRIIALETAKLVKKYKGSLSGEHGDGRLRGEFIPLMMGEKLYEVFKDIKNVWDPKNIFNPNKIVNTPPMNTSLRYKPGAETKEIKTIFDFSATAGFIRTAEKCNGSGDCRKSHIIGGTLCPSFQATKDEKNTTRARANMLREIFTNSSSNMAFASKELYEVLDLCLLCKACKSECPSGVDVAKLKMEFLQHYYDIHGIPLRTFAIAYLPVFHKMFSFSPNFMNFFLENKFSSKVLKYIIGFNQKRDFPLMNKSGFKKLYKEKLIVENKKPIKTIYLFNDEFTKYLETDLGIKTILLFEKLGYEVKLAPISYSGRTWLSKGLIRRAKKLANKNIEILKNIISEQTPLIGIEPSAILSFRDEYPDLANPENKEIAQNIANSSFLFDEFIASEFEKGNISSDFFTEEELKIKFHGHCQQKSLITTKYTKKILSIPKNYKVTEIPSGCCGMAGSFGYEKEHYDLSMKIGELVLFPEVRNADDDTLIVAVGTSCRCHIKDGTGKKSYHPIEVLWEAL